jgi:small conductance mechanosensitive channel
VKLGDLESLFGDQETVTGMLVFRGLRILLIVLMVALFIRLMRTVSRKIVQYSQDEDHTTQSEREKRAETLAQIIGAASHIFGYTIGLFMILRELGLNIAPLLTGAGIAGVALGLGAQSIVRDFLSGFFILMENQYRVGDVVGVGEHEGLVEQITLRTTILRDVEGVVHIVPNGEIKSVRNLTYGWSRIKLDVGIAYETDLDRAMAVLAEIGAGMAADPVFGPKIMEPPQVLGVERLDDWQVVIRIIVKTLPRMQWEVAREYRRRIKDGFDARGIPIPFPRQVVSLTREPRGPGEERRAEG